MDLKEKTDEELIEMATFEAIKLIKDPSYDSNAKEINQELKKRGISIGVSRNLIKKVFDGEL